MLVLKILQYLSQHRLKEVSVIVASINSKKKQKHYSMSGKLFTEQQWIDNLDYLLSVDGARLNIEKIVS